MRTIRPHGRRKVLHVLLTAMLVMAPLATGSRPAAQQQQPADVPQFTESTSINIVSVDVVVRDAKGEIVRGLTAKDFSVFEDGKRQVVENFSFQEIADSIPV